jgi:hypothetical protein
MKNLFMFILLLPVLLSSKTLHKTEIIIFGVVHEATDNFDAEDMLKILNQVKPEVILFEHPISWDANEFSELVPKIKNPTFETIMVKKYLDENPSVILRYYDIANRNKYYIETQYFEQEKAFNEKLDNLIKKSESDDSASLQAEQIIMLLNFANLNNSLLKEYPRVINSSAGDSICAINVRYLLSISLKFTETIPDLEQFKEFITSKEEYWDRRNQTMTENIINYAKGFQGKRIIVTTGFEHRYYLRKELQQSKKQNYIIKEYWEY